MPIDPRRGPARAGSASPHPSSEPLTRGTCPSCGASGQERFCPACGQERLEGRHTLTGFGRGILARVVGEEGVVHTAVQLAVRPGRVIRDYVGGKTRRYVNPVGYLLVMAAAFTLVGRVVSGSTGAADSDRLLAILVIPFVAGVSRLLNGRRGFNLAEHLILVTYLGAQLLALLTLLHVGLLVMPAGARPTYALFALGAGSAYYLWAYVQFFESRRVIALLMGILSLVLGSALWLGLLVLIVGLLRR